MVKFRIPAHVRMLQALLQRLGFTAGHLVAGHLRESRRGGWDVDLWFTPTAGGIRRAKARLILGAGETLWGRNKREYHSLQFQDSDGSWWEPLPSSYRQVGLLPPDEYGRS